MSTTVVRCEAEGIGADDDENNTGARYELAIDGTSRTYRDTEKMAIEGATHLKTKQPHSEITVRDLQTGKVTSVKHQLQSR